MLFGPSKDKNQTFILLIIQNILDILNLDPFLELVEFCLSVNVSIFKQRQPLEP